MSETSKKAELATGQGLLSRRSAIGRLAGAGVCACCVGWASGCEEADEAGNTGRPAPRPQPKVQPGMVPVVPFARLAPNVPQQVSSGPFPIWVVRARDEQLQEELIAYDGRCPHAGCKFNYDTDKTRTFRCPCHGSRFKLTGELVNGPARRDLRRLRCQRNTQTDGVEVDYSEVLN